MRISVGIGKEGAEPGGESEESDDSQLIDLDEIGSDSNIRSLVESMDVDEISRNLEIRYNQFMHEESSMDEVFDELESVDEIEPLPLEDVDTEELVSLPVAYEEEQEEEDVIELDTSEDLTLFGLDLTDGYQINYEKILKKQQEMDSAVEAEEMTAVATMAEDENDTVEIDSIDHRGEIGKKVDLDFNITHDGNENPDGEGIIKSMNDNKKSSDLNAGKSEVTPDEVEELTKSKVG